MSCTLCQRIELIKEGKYPFLIHEYPNSYLLLGEQQFYKGYCVLVSKNHFVEMSDVPSPQREEIFQEMMISSKIIQKEFRPKKMNLTSLGNVCEHLHWHFHPRYADDPDFKNSPWLQILKFDSVVLTPSERDLIISSLKKELSK